jgi:predicted dehydrogenase
MLNLAVIGCGRMATELAERSLKLGRANIAAIYDPNSEALATACEKFSAKPFTDLNTLANDSGVDAFSSARPRSIIATMFWQSPLPANLSTPKSRSALPSATATR